MGVLDVALSPGAKPGNGLDLCLPCTGCVVPMGWCAVTAKVMVRANPKWRLGTAHRLSAEYADGGLFPPRGRIRGSTPSLSYLDPVRCPGPAVLGGVEFPTGVPKASASLESF